MSRRGRGHSHKAPMKTLMRTRANDVIPTMYTSEISDMFDKAKAYMDQKRDKDEEIMRFTRDCTWEAKKIIYILHQFFHNSDSLQKAEDKLNELLTNERYFLGLARALEGQDLSLHYRRYTHCLQEYVEAIVFLSFLKDKKVPTYEEIRDRFIFIVPVESFPEEPFDENNSIELDKPTETTEVTKYFKEPVMKTLTVPLSLMDYILGVSDFTGELMKAAVPTLTRPQWHLFLCQSFAMVREIYAQFTGLVPCPKSFRQKMNQMRGNVLKIEATVYKLKIKILLYGRLPDSKELKMIEESVASEQIKSNPGDDKDDKSNENDNLDSGVE